MRDQHAARWRRLYRAAALPDCKLGFIVKRDPSRHNGLPGRPRTETSNVVKTKVRGESYRDLSRLLRLVSVRITAMRTRYRPGPASAGCGRRDSSYGVACRLFDTVRRDLARPRVRNDPQAAT